MEKNFMTNAQIKKMAFELKGNSILFDCAQLRGKKQAVVFAKTMMELMARGGKEAVHSSWFNGCHLVLQAKGVTAGQVTRHLNRLGRDIYNLKPHNYPAL